MKLKFLKRNGYRTKKISNEDKEERKKEYPPADKKFKKL